MLNSRIIVKYHETINMYKEMEERVPVTNDSTSDCSIDNKAKAQKELVEALKDQWKLLWSERYNDKVRAEAVSEKDYEILYLERGTVISATRDFKVLSFKDILEKHMIEQPDRFIQPNVNVGGWKKFVKTNISNNKPQRNNCTLEKVSKKQATQQSKKNRPGWLHAT